MHDTKGPLLNCVRIVVALLCCVSVTGAQTACVLKDPGPRPAGNTVLYIVPDGHGNVIPNFTQQSQSGTHNSSGNALPNLTLNQFNFWESGMAKFGDIASVQGVPPGVTSPEPLPGLGPRFNSNSCSSCHAQPAVGGTGAAVNPQFAFAGSSVAPKDDTVLHHSQRPDP